MAYTKQTWTDGSAATPLSAARLAHIEDGIAAADTAAGAAVTWGSVTGKPAVIGAGADAAAARLAIGAGTGSSSLALGTSGTTAKAGDYQPTWAQVTAKPATVTALPATLGTAGQILAVNAAGTGLEWITPA